MKLYNNTAWNNQINYFFGVKGGQDTLRNNVSFGKLGNVSGASTTYNSWTLPVTVNDADFAGLNDACAKGPRQADGSLPNCSFLRLAAGSDLINKGTNVGIPYSGSAPDLGAFEYGGSSVSDTTPPTVSITAPASGATVSGAAVTVSATASDNVGVAGVQFKLDGANLGAEDTTSPYSVTWNSTTVTTGSHTLTAVARDAAGNTRTSATVSVTVNNAASDTTPPTVSITAPASGATVSGAAVTVSATASDNVGVAGVQFKRDGANLGAEDTTAPYSVTWNSTTVATGSHTLTAVARDAAGNTRTSATVTVTVNNAASDTTPPTVSITAPASGATVSGAAVTVSATASDNVGVAGVRFKLDGTNLGAEDTSSPYSVTWNSTTATTGSHTLTAVARDAAGNVGTSAGVIVLKCP